MRRPKDRNGRKNTRRALFESHKRAEAIKKMLVDSYGLDAGQIEFDGKGWMNHSALTPTRIAALKYRFSHLSDSSFNSEGALIAEWRW